MSSGPRFFYHPFFVLIVVLVLFFLVGYDELH